MLMQNEPASTTLRSGKPRHVLAVDDDRTALMVLEQNLLDLGYVVSTASGGAEAMERLKAGDRVDVVVLDRRMPQVDGMEVVRRMKADPALQSIPAVMLTGASEDKEIEEGVAAGVFYYLVKPANPALLRTVIAAAMREAEQRKLLDGRSSLLLAALERVDTCRLYFHTLEEAAEVAALLSECFPNPDRVAEGLLELLRNAVEHGIFQIGYALKAEVLRYGSVDDYLRPYYGTEDYASLRAEAVFTRKNGSYSVIITDPGPGFDWRSYLTINPERAVDSHGRGIARAAQAAFDRVSYNESGNRVVASVSGEDPLNW